MKNLILTIALLASTVIFAQNIEPKLEIVGQQVKATYFFENGNIQQEGFFTDGKLCRSIPQRRAASAREEPSSTNPIANRRRATAASRVRPATARSDAASCSVRIIWMAGMICSPQTIRKHARLL